MNNKCCIKGSQEQKNIKEIKSILETLNDINRLRILCLLSKEKELCVCEIFKALKLPQNLVSYHLSVLIDNNLVTFKRQGVKIIYQKNKTTLIKFKQKLINLLN
jgi:ArsR family transcriptional regulator